MKFKRIQFESTNYCSMKCEFCPNKKMTRSRLNLDTGLFKKIINDITENNLTDSISFAGNGEPLIDPGILEKLKYCKEKGLKTIITTNGLQMDRINEEVLKNLDCLYISWQTFNKETFKLRNTSIDYSDYKKNLINFIKSNKGKIKIVISMMIDETKKRLMHDLLGKKFRSLFKQNIKDLKITMEEISFGSINKINKALESGKRLSCQEIEIENNLFLNVDQISDWGGNIGPHSKNFIRTPEKNGNCKIMADGPLILADGRLSLCCVDYDGSVTIGDLRNENINNVVNGKKYSTITENFKNKHIILPYCQNCKGYWRHRNPIINFLYKFEYKINTLLFKK